jgi:hypothetical protein
MPKDILSDFDTLCLGGGFFLNQDKLYFFSSEELQQITVKCIEKLKEIL